MYAPRMTEPPRQRTQCEVCLKRTTDGKPYCVRHLDRLDYVAYLEAMENYATEEVDRALNLSYRYARIDTEGPVSLEIVRVLRHEGPATVARICRDVPWLNGKPEAVEAYIRALKLVVTYTERKSRVLALRDGHETP